MKHTRTVCTVETWDSKNAMERAQLVDLAGINRAMPYEVRRDGDRMTVRGFLVGTNRQPRREDQLRPFDLAPGVTVWCDERVERILNEADIRTVSRGLLS